MARRPICAALLTSAAFRDALDAADAVREHFNALPEDLENADPVRHEAEMVALGDATHNGDRAVPATWQEYARLIEHMSDGGLSAIDDDNGKLLLEHARRLSAPTPGPSLAELIAESDRRDAIAGQHQADVLNRDGFDTQDEPTRMAQIADNNALNEAWCEAMDNVAAFPAWSVQDLRAKLAFMNAHDMGEGCNWLEEITADLERIANPPQPDRAAWKTAFTALEVVKGAEAEVTARYNAAEASAEGVSDDMDKEWEKAIDATIDAVWFLFAIPSPDAAAFLWKTEYLFGDMIADGNGSPSWSAKVMATFMADARRLLANGAV
jgi:hypothetical protein